MNSASVTKKRQRLELGNAEVAAMKAGKIGVVGTSVARDANGNIDGAAITVQVGDTYITVGGFFGDMSISFASAK